jgi:peptide/nickel transport system ATP-binding protein
MGLSYLFITHNIGVVEYIADAVAVMRAGQIVESGDCHAVLQEPQQAYTRELLAAVPRLTMGSGMGSHARHRDSVVGTQHL